MDVMRDNDPAETHEWLQALGSVLAYERPERAEFFLEANGGCRVLKSRRVIPGPSNPTTMLRRAAQPDGEDSKQKL